MSGQWLHDGRQSEQRRHRPHRGAETPQAQRSIAIALALGILVVLFFAVTMVKGPAVLNRPL